MSFGDDDLAMMLSDAFAVAVTFGATTTSGIVGFHDVQQFDEDGSVRVIGRERAVTLTTAEAASLATGDAITVDGSSYTVREKLAQTDGATTLVFLRG